MSEPRPVSRAIDRRHFVAGGVAATAASLLGAGRADAHEEVMSDAVCATFGDWISNSSLNAAAMPTGRPFRAVLERGARRPSHLREGQPVAVQLVEPAEVDAATVGADGPVRARRVTGLIVGTRADIQGRAID
jgi:hypothetical protein